MRVRVGDIDIDYRLDGPEDAPAVVFIHSLGTSRAAWDDVVPAFARHFRVLTYSIRGHGKTTATEGAYTLDQLAGDLAGLMDALGIARAHIVGLSIGGMIAQVFALDYGDRVDRLVICASASELPAGADKIWQERIETTRREGMKTQVAGALERWFAGDFLERRPDVAERVATMMGSTPKAGYIGCCAAISGLDLTARLGAIAAPTLVVVGAEDPGTPPSSSETIADAVPNARLVVLDRLSHQLALQDPERFTEAVLPFLTGED